MTSSSIALIGDLVGSREAPSRREVQEHLIAALATVADSVPALQAPAPTIGDEFQAVYEGLAEALRASVIVRLALPAGMDARCGLGRGALEIVGSSEYGLTQDGPAWWAARDAIVEVKRREAGRHPGLRTWFADPEDRGDAVMVNAHLLARDELVSRLDGRQRRLVLGLLLGRSQASLAADEDISASAVSQSLRRAGAWSVIDGLDLLGATSDDA